MAKLSLQEQLLKSGLVSSGHAKAVKSEKHKLSKQQQHNKTATIDEAKALAQKARLEQAEKDRELNLQRKQQELQKELAAQIKQLIKENRQNLNGQDDDSVAYHFTDNNKVKTLYVSKTVREQISHGQMVIVKLGKLYEIVTAEIAEKIKMRDEACVIVFNKAITLEENQEDPYAAFQVPDDLTW
jgi:uncharacterized protein